MLQTLSHCHVSFYLSLLFPVSAQSEHHQKSEHRPWNLRFEVFDLRSAVSYWRDNRARPFVSRLGTGKHLGGT